MSPHNFAGLLASDIYAWATRKSQQARAEGRDAPEYVWLQRLASRAGVTVRQLYRYMSEESMPPADRLITIVREIGSARAVEQLALDCGLGVYRRGRETRIERADQVELVGSLVHEAGHVAGEVLRTLRAGQVPHSSFRPLEQKLDQIIDAVMELKSVLRAAREPVGEPNG